jgi:hypothetical protein
MLGVAFSTKLWHFMITQGVMQGIASGFIFPICVRARPRSGNSPATADAQGQSAFPSQWFRKKRAFSTGIVLSGSSFGVCKFIGVSSLSCTHAKAQALL